jgi:uncharacterized membrane protein YhhN
MGGSDGMTRALWYAALVAGVSYMAPVLLDWHGPLVIAWKGASVGLLALWAAWQAKSLDGWLITGVMALGAIGDVLIDAVGLEAGGSAFALGHVLALFLYLKNPRPAQSGSQRLLGIVVLPAALMIALASQGPLGEVLQRIGIDMTRDGWSPLMSLLLYTALVAMMAAAAWASRFPRYRTGLGAMAFLASDLLIFAGEGGAIGDALRSWTVWPLYFGGQALIVWGIVTTLNNDRTPA